MWIAVLLFALVCFSKTEASVCRSVRIFKAFSFTLKEFCEDVFDECQRAAEPWTRCYEERIANCSPRRRHFPGLSVLRPSKEAQVIVSSEHSVHIPSSALQMSLRNTSEENVRLITKVIDSTFFKESPPPGKANGSTLKPDQIQQSTVLGKGVLAVRAGQLHVRNLSQAITLTFKYNSTVKGGQEKMCVFWQDLQSGSGYWSMEGCETNDTGNECICSCNHLSFFAVLVNPALSSVDKTNSASLSYITYIGSAFSVFFTVISLIIYICLQRRRPEKAIGVHMQLTGALLCLHLSFLLCCLWASLMELTEGGWVCRGLGLFLHWSLLATFSWCALEGFHIYLLLVRVFNIYVRRYLLKLSLLGWGVPTLTAVVCGISGVYGTYSLELRDDNNQNSTAHMCWMSSGSPYRLLVSYLTTVAFPCLVILCNCCMLGLVVAQLWGLRRDNMNRKDRSRLWKDCATVLGLSCVLGLPWGLASTTYISLSGIYLFTILNSMQGLFMFLWCLALTCKFRSESNSSVKDPSTQKIMTTSFNT